MTAIIEETINESPLFKHIGDEWKQRLVESAQLRAFEGGEVIIEEGQQAESLFIVVRGRVRVWTESDGRQVELKTLGQGAYFGEVSLLSGKEATATVEAKTDDVTTVALDRSVLLELFGEDDKVRRMLEGVTLARAKDTIGKVLK
ncbi:cyclic nucleotide-binding domain-containing protein [Persicimonas caeni]|uniref:Cyclic nucleotide-binding domain-containing protein n=1 Tax=Persicimonas caeni TaxID=2292766 RepID=A0A4Y6PLR2_PERCE|nr:cyclic nucleotide-binding domain-containing protein [Persicimonas caeni]QDG49231.1 cyclic nucleotide-binding domain-containing protein [Persicimonas caeni]QED30452.1 cyclic nucleotide-binding domain-containing protein [Persicimonas caeni]